jgi:hypothetical protein
VLAAVAGLVWTGVAPGSGGLVDPDLVLVAGVALPNVLLVGGLALGIVLGLVCHVIARRVASRRARVADERLRAAVSGVARELVVAPVETELAAYTSVRAGLGRAQA